MKMTWQQQREQWNRDNQCAREACRGSLVRPGRKSRYGRHTGTNLLYCAVCTRLLTEAQGDVMVVVEVEANEPEPPFASDPESDRKAQGSIDAEASGEARRISARWTDIAGEVHGGRRPPEPTARKKVEVEANEPEVQDKLT